MKVGDKVTLSVDSEFHDPDGEDEFNPFGIVGVVTDVDDDAPEGHLNINVDWGVYSSGPLGQPITNSYSIADLELV